ncbi:MAG TPA: hypothetical protein VJ385_14715 [Fibrobacteria bacterium]|nr:hypothetical protein [Fibrobacteria bacterium]
MNRQHCFGLALASLAWLIPGGAAAQGKTFTGENYGITFPAGWDIIRAPNVIAKISAFAMGIMGASAGTTLPDVDSLTAAFSDSLGGPIRKDSSGVKTLGKYQVHWQKYAYDTLPRLSALITKEAPFIPPLKDGSFRVYYLVSDGVSFSTACLSLLHGGIAPYGEVEQAILTLKLGALAGIRDVARASGPDLWIRGGKLGGAWLQAHHPVSIEGFDARGALLGAAVPASEGAWVLPSAPETLFLRVRAADGSSLRLAVHP